MYIYVYAPQHHKLTVKHKINDVFPTPSSPTTTTFNGILLTYTNGIGIKIILWWLFVAIIHAIM